MTRTELLSSKGYWIAKIQMDLYQQITAYMDQNDINRTQLAERLGVTKGYVSQVLNGDFDHKISKLVDLALLMGKVPQLTFVDVNEYIQNDTQPTPEAILIEPEPIIKDFLVKVKKSA